MRKGFVFGRPVGGIGTTLLLGNAGLPRVSDRITETAHGQFTKPGHHNGRHGTDQYDDDDYAIHERFGIIALLPALTMPVDSDRAISQIPRIHNPKAAIGPKAGRRQLPRVTQE